MISVVCWCWGRYSLRHVAVLQSMVGRHLRLPHRVCCVTDRPGDVPDGVTAVPMVTDPLNWRNTRILWQYSRDAAAVLGGRILSLNLDVVITGDITPLIDRPEPFVIYRSESRKRRGFAYNTTMVLFDGGCRSDIWERYCENPQGMLDAAGEDGWGRGNSDQSVVCYCVHRDNPATWDERDGVYSFRTMASRLPKDARLVSFHGKDDPSDPQIQARAPWILEHWR